MNTKKLSRGNTIFAGCLLLLFVNSLCAGWTYQEVREQGIALYSGFGSRSKLIRGSDGVYYGTTSAGGVEQAGTVFRMDGDGANYRVLHSFVSATDGSMPMGELLEASDGMLYGTTRVGGYYGGPSAGGSVFRMNKDGSGFQPLYFFGGYNGLDPVGGLIEGANGKLFGTTSRGGGVQLWGTVFTISKDGTGFSTIHRFDSSQVQGRYPECTLLLASDGILYGTTSNRGAVFKIDEAGQNYTEITGSGDSVSSLLELEDGYLYVVGGYSVFRVMKDGTGLEVLHTFGTDPGDGTAPKAGLLARTDGFLYGTTLSGGAFDAGTVYRMLPDGSSYEILHSFGASGQVGVSPYAGLVEGPGSTLLGTTFLNDLYGGDGTVFKIQPDGSGFENIIRFSRTGYDGIISGPLLYFGDSFLYGMTANAGTNGAGTLFRLRKDGADYEAIRNFGTAIGDPVAPTGAPVRAQDGKFYCVSYSGGASGKGSVFRLNTDGTELEVLRNLGTTIGDGERPVASLIQASDGLFYGTTSEGGDSGFGTVFKIDSAGNNYSVIHHFGVADDGKQPFSQLIEGTDGLLYGTTSTGGSNNKGTVFRLNKSGASYTILHSFSGVTFGDGEKPMAELIETTGGTLLGTTEKGGSQNLGTIFRLSKSGAGFAVLLNFSGSNTGDGAAPNTGLVRGLDGSYYGTTSKGGSGFGTVYRIKPDGTGYQVFYRFTGWISSPPLDGKGLRSPDPKLTLVDDGVFYGSATGGGNFDIGAVFQVSFPLRLLGVSNPSSPACQLSFDGDPGRTYQVDVTDSLALPQWTSLGSKAVDAFGEMTVVDPGSNGKNNRFYRFQPVP